MTTLWSCPNPDYPPTAVAPVELPLSDDDSSEEAHLTTEDVAKLLHVPITTLYKWLAQGRGPSYFRVGKHFRYRKSEVMRWLISEALARCGSKCRRTYPRNVFKEVAET